MGDLAKQKTAEEVSNGFIGAAAYSTITPRRGCHRSDDITAHTPEAERQSRVWSRRGLACAALLKA